MSVNRAMALCAAMVGLTACAGNQPSSNAEPNASAEVPAAHPDSLAHLIAEKPVTSRARNVIIFIGDGMGISTITAGRIFDGQERGVDGESNSLAFESFPYSALVKTYNTNQQVPDSAGTATAMFTGTKTRAGVIAVHPDVNRRNCLGQLAQPLESVLDQAEGRQLKTGIVTTTRITHATPASLYAKSAERDWEDDSYLPEAVKAAGCSDIARQLVEYTHGDGPDVVLGGGRKNFLPVEAGGSREDNRNLIEQWLDGAPARTAVSTRQELAAAPREGQLLGLFSASHMTYVLDRKPANTEPTLTEMTLAALDRLQRSENGYFLMVEGGRIDHAHHDGVAHAALLEVQAFSDAIAAVLERVNVDETLILVTADHSHVFSIGGYPTRGNPILGLVQANDTSGNPSGSPVVDIRGTPYSTLGYYNGPGAVATGQPRPHPDLRARGLQQALVPTFSRDAKTGRSYLSETHAGEDVALFGRGPWAHLVRGVLEQNVIYDLMTFALGWASTNQSTDRN